MADNSPAPASTDTSGADKIIAETLQLAISCHQAGRLGDAKALYRSILEFQPRHAGAQHHLGLLFMQAGQLEAALEHLTNACALVPETGSHWISVADCLLRLERPQECIQVLETAIQAGLRDSETDKLLAQARAGLALLPASPSAAPETLDAEIAPHAQPDTPEEDPLVELKALVQRSKRRAAMLPKKRQDPAVPAPLAPLMQNADWEGLRAAALEGVKKNPVHGKTWDLLGIAYLQLCRNEAAHIALTRARELLPKDAEVWDHLGVALRILMQHNTAEDCFKRSLKLDPNRPDTWTNLGNLQQAQARPEDAIVSHKRALALQPDYVTALNNLAIAYKNAEQLEASEATIRRALQLQPNLAEPHSNLANVLRDQGKLQEALACYGKALELDPLVAKTHCNLGQTLYSLGQNAPAIAITRRALDLDPDYFDAYTKLFFYLSHDEDTLPEEIFAAHKAFGEHVEPPLRKFWPIHQNNRDPLRRLRIGFVSADLRNHAVASFIEPIWAALDPGQFEIWAYSNRTKEDETSQRLKHWARSWRKVAGLTDEILARQIMEDQIDILVDLSGHTGDHRLLTFARKPSPIQASWIGYPNTTGLTAMDYYLADRYLAPAGLTDDLFTEKIVRLPCTATFQPYARAPEISPLPAFTQGVFTFGSFNRSSKLGNGVIALWSRALQSVPDSRMILAGLSHKVVDAHISARLTARFAEHGITSDRLSFHPLLAIDAYLEFHNQIDLILDTFPYGGGTTTFHAAWMGIPVLTLAGRTLPSRQGATVNAHLGLTEFITESEENFVAQASKWSHNLPELAAIRGGLRERMLNSPLTQPKKVARGLERAFRTMWQHWCQELPPESFEVTP
jgi:predicted O-linked N-acetylglucosamine transferase (SPINDLY family)